MGVNNISGLFYVLHYIMYYLYANCDYLKYKDEIVYDKKSFSPDSVLFFANIGCRPISISALKRVILLFIEWIIRQHNCANILLSF